MRTLATLVAVLAALVLAPAAVATGSPAAGDGAASRTDRLAFDTPIGEFLRVRARHPAGLDWSSDGCSVPLLHEPRRSQPHGFDFRAACERHDFGYRNLRAQDRLTEDLRRRVDDVFLADMDDVCAGVDGWFGLRQRLCRHVAGDYHFWVRSCGANPAPYCPAAARDRFDEYLEH